MVLDNLFNELKTNGFIEDKHSKYKAGDVAEWRDGPHRKRADGTWKKIGRDELPDNSENDNIKLKVTSDIRDGKGFKNTLVKAKNTQPLESAWRVDTDYHEPKDYLNKVLITTPAGSCACVTKDGDIISVCKNKNDSITGSQLLSKAVKNGGLKLDSFDGNFKFYHKNGFEPVSWCRFDKEYAPNGWDEKRDNEEPIIFFKYVGSNKTKYKSSKDFYKSVPASKGYDEAQKIRDKGVHHAHTRGI